MYELGFGCILCFISGTLFIILIRTWFIVPGRNNTKAKKGKRSQPVKTMIVLGSGGHTAEMFRILRGMDCQMYSPRIYVKAQDDKISIAHCDSFESQKAKILNIPRARQVGQSYWTSIFTTLKALGVCVKMVWQECPSVIICNGPGTCVPICVSSFLRRFFGNEVKIIYVESICRVEDLSLSAKLLYLMVDKMFVQWPNLTKKYPKAEYIGLLSH